MKHTKGPWGVSTRPEQGITVHSLSGPYAYDSNYALASNITNDNVANLIAAAPELLEAVIELTEIVRRFGDMGADPFKWDKLILKATGETYETKD